MLEIYCKKTLMPKVKKIIIYFEKKFEVCFEKLFIHLKIIKDNSKFIFKLEILDFVDDDNLNISLRHPLISGLC